LYTLDIVHETIELFNHNIGTVADKKQSQMLNFATTSTYYDVL